MAMTETPRRAPNIDTHRIISNTACFPYPCSKTQIYVQDPVRRDEGERNVAGYGSRNHRSGEQLTAPDRDCAFTENQYFDAYIPLRARRTSHVHSDFP